MTQQQTTASSGGFTHSNSDSGFSAMALCEPLLRAVRDAGHTTPTPIQTRALPPALNGQDVLGIAQTGTGKTAAFALPILQRLDAQAAPQGKARLRALILSPTRELASQIGQSFERYGKYTKLRHLTLFGGVSQQPQVTALQRGVDILVATPGRLCDLMAQGLVDLSSIQVFVLDEADRMLDEGFLPDVRRVVRALPHTKRQTMFFSATMPPETEALAAQVLSNPVRVAVSPVSSTPDRVDQAVYLVEQRDKRALLNHLLTDRAIARAIVFTRTKHGANRVARQLLGANVEAEAIHGNKSQNARERALSRFRDGDLRVLVATDIAARGIDVQGITHVVNYDIPVDPEAYVHRIGRTGRAGSEGAALSLCSSEERKHLTSIERLIKRRVPVRDVPGPALALAAHAEESARPTLAPRGSERAQAAQRSERAQAAQRSERGAERSHGLRNQVERSHASHRFERASSAPGSERNASPARADQASGPARRRRRRRPASPAPKTVS